MILYVTKNLYSIKNILLKVEKATTYKIIHNSSCKKLFINTELSNTSVSALFIVKVTFPILFLKWYQIFFVYLSYT